MLRSIKSLLSFTISATDGDIGKVEEFYFDDTTWIIRYMIVKTGGWLTGKEVLISPLAILKPDWEKKVIPVNLTMDQVRNSPDIDTDKPISRQEEDKLFGYYAWQSYYNDGLLYGDGMGIMGTIPIAPLAIENTELEDMNKEPEIKTHLRSTHEVSGYIIHATDGEIGEISDFILDKQTWKINFIVVKTGNLLSEKKVLISPSWIKEVHWNMQEVVVNVSVDAVKSSPVYDASTAIDSDYRQGLNDHYGFPPEI